jgi:hypothetical protein
MLNLEVEEIKLFITSVKTKDHACDLPSGKNVVESPKTGLPFVKG